MDTKSDLSVVTPVVFVFQQWSSLPNLESGSPPKFIYRKNIFQFMLYLYFKLTETHNKSVHIT